MNSSISFRALAAGVLLAVPFALAACGTDAEPASSSSAAAGDCPTTPVDVVVSVDQWGTIVSALAGACADVTTVLSGSSIDPHDFEPAPSDAAAFEGAQLVVINGGHYDEWAAKLAESTAPDAPIVDAMAILEGDHEGHDHEEPGHEGHDHEEPGHEEPGHEGHGHDGANPHVWYSPVAVADTADAVTAKLTELAPAAGEYFSARHTEFTEALAPYRDLIAEIKAGATGKSYAATESLFDDMAAELGLANRTPQGYQVASSNESDPSPADLDAFLRLLSDRGVDVLIYNTQTEGSVPEQLRAAAEGAGVPVVDVTETPPPGAPTFEAWQVDQLTSLAEALGVR